jgi:hypothetical protein
MKIHYQAFNFEDIQCIFTKKFRFNVACVLIELSCQAFSFSICVKYIGDVMVLHSL